MNHRVDERRIHEHAGIVQRQQEAEVSADARREGTMIPTVLPAPVSASSQHNHSYAQPHPAMPQPRRSPIYARPDHDAMIRRHEESEPQGQQIFLAPDNNTSRLSDFPEPQTQDVTPPIKLVPNR
jgi:hypothetical protein